MKQIRFMSSLLILALLLGACAAAAPATTETLPAELPLPTEAAETTAPPEETQPPEEIFPQFYQNDYPEAPYGGGTVATSGCGIVSLAMVASYLTGHMYYPDELAFYFGGRAENNIARMESGCEVLQLPYEKPENFDALLKEMEAGKVAIVMLDGESPFTDGQHMIVLRGMTPEGRLLVNDPARGNYAVWELKEGFEKGFDPDRIRVGYSGSWVFDKTAMPDIPYIYSDLLPPDYILVHQRKAQKKDYPVIELSPEEQRLMAAFLWQEAREEPQECQQAIVEVMMNRMAVKNVDLFALLDPAALEQIKPENAQYEAITLAERQRILPREVTQYSREEGSGKIWGKLGNFYFSYPDK